MQTCQLQVVERSFGHLLACWPRLKYMNQKSKQKRVEVIVAACALHNYCIMVNDMQTEDLQMEIENVRT